MIVLVVEGTKTATGAAKHAISAYLQGHAKPHGYLARLKSCPFKLTHYRSGKPSFGGRDPGRQRVRSGAAEAVSFQGCDSLGWRYRLNVAGRISSTSTHSVG